MPHDWKSGNKAVVDFLVQHQNNIITFEVKSEENIRSKSLAFYRKDYNPPLSIRYSLRNLRQDEGLINIPLFLVDYTKKLIELYEK
jgi:predicted AAA+ superfamily ATPase